MNAEGRPQPLPVQVLGTAVLLQEEAVLEVLTALGVYERSLRFNGVQPSPRLLGLQRAFAVAASVRRGQQEPMSVGPVADVRTGAALSESYSHQWIGTTEVASVLGVTERHARRLAATLDARRVRGAWLFNREAVETYLAASLDHRPTAA